MKPPPRIRNKPKRQSPEPSPPSKANSGGEWHRVERRRLLSGLNKLSPSRDHNGDIDYNFLKTCVPSRSVEEIRSMVESLKDKAASYARHTVMTRQRQEKRLSKPIQLWTEMASAVVGKLELPISTAFSQVLKVASMEPLTLENSDPPQSHTVPTVKGKKVVRTILVPQSCSPLPGKHPSRSAAGSQALSTNSTASGTNTSAPPTQEKLSASPNNSTLASLPQSVTESIVVPVPGVQQCPGPGPQMTKQPPAQPPVPVLPSCPSNPGSLSSGSAASALSSTPVLLPPASTVQAKFNPTCKQNPQKAPKRMDAKNMVDFGKIYRYLGLIHQKDEQCHLTPMESAIVLDLLMSLPEEVGLLDCKKLHEHLTQVYACLSSPAGSKKAKAMFPGLKDTQRSQHSKTANSQQDAATAVSSSGDQSLQPDGGESQTTERQSTSSQSVDSDNVRLCPPLNPFMIPLKLLMRK